MIVDDGSITESTFHRIIIHLFFCCCCFRSLFCQGYFNYTIMYYGGYSNETLVGQVEYNMQLAYFFTIAVYMVLCGIALIFRLVPTFQTFA